MSEQCQSKIMNGFHRYQCQNKAKKGGYCGVHHPDAVKRRREKRDHEYAEGLAAREAARAARQAEHDAKATQAAYEIHRAHCDNQMFTPGDAPTGCEHLTYQYGHSQSIAPCAEHYTGCPLHVAKCPDCGGPNDHPTKSSKCKRINIQRSTNAEKGGSGEKD